MLIIIMTDPNEPSASLRRPFENVGSKVAQNISHSGVVRPTTYRPI